MGLEEKEFKIILKDYIKVSTNKIYAGKHWTFRKKLKNDYLQWFSIYKNKFPKFDYKVNLDFKFYFKGRCLDSTNNSYQIKLLEDCMSYYEIIKDDTIKYVGRVSMESLKGEEDYCELTISKY